MAGKKDKVPPTVDLGLGGWPEGLAHNLQIPQQVFNEIQDFYIQDAFSSVGVLQPYFKSSKGIGHTSLHRGILTRFAVEIFFL